MAEVPVTTIAPNFKPTRDLIALITGLLIPERPATLPGGILSFDVWEAIIPYIYSTEEKVREASPDELLRRRHLYWVSHTCRTLRYYSERSMRWFGRAMDTMVSRWVEKQVDGDEAKKRKGFLEALQVLDADAIRACALALKPIPLTLGNGLLRPAHQVCLANALRRIVTPTQFAWRYCLKTSWFSDCEPAEMTKDLATSLHICSGKRDLADPKMKEFPEVSPEIHIPRLIAALKALVELGFCDPVTEPLAFYVYYGGAHHLRLEATCRVLQAFSQSSINCGTSSNGYTCLHEAVEQHDAEATKKFIELGADPHQGLVRAFSSSHCAGTTPLDVARQELADAPHNPDCQAVAAVLSDLGFDV